MAELTENDHAMDTLLDYISRSAYTEKELRTKLFKKGYSGGAVSYAIGKALEYGYINDAEYAKRYAQVYGKQRGKIRLKNELRTKGVADEFIDSALSEKDDDLQNAKVFAAKFAKNNDLSDRKVRDKLARQLSYRGYGWDIINECIRGDGDDF